MGLQQHTNNDLFTQYYSTLLVTFSLYSVVDANTNTGPRSSRMASLHGMLPVELNCHNTHSETSTCHRSLWTSLNVWPVPSSERLWGIASLRSTVLKRPGESQAIYFCKPCAVGGWLSKDELLIWFFWIIGILLRSRWNVFWGIFLNPTSKYQIRHALFYQNIGIFDLNWR